MYEVNLTAVLVATIASMILGSIWFSPSVFGRTWMKGAGINEKKMAEMQKKGMGKAYALGFVAAFITAYVLAQVLNLFGATTVETALQTALWLWLGFVATVLSGLVLWEGKPFSLYLVVVGHWLMTFVMNSLIITLWA